MRFLLAWELGGGFGHVAPMRGLARELRARGHECVFAVRRLESAARYLDVELGPLLQAPFFQRQERSPGMEPLSYASVLYNCGSHSTEALNSRLRSWRDLMQMSRCDVLIADHSPTALLAARTLSLPSAVIGTGFSIPPPLTPLPSFRSDLEVDTATLLASETVMLDIVNQSLASFGSAPLPALHALFAASYPGLFTYPELDHYGLPRPQPHLGQPDYSHGINVSWGQRRETRVFAYLRPFPGLPGLLEALYRLRAQVLVRLADVDLGTYSSLRREGFVLADREIHLSTVARSCDVFVNYAAHGTVAHMLLAGKPGLLLPQNRERLQIADRSAAIGACLRGPVGADSAYAPLLQQLIEDGDLRRGAERFAARHGAQRREDILPQWCEEFLATLE